MPAAVPPCRPVETFSFVAFGDVEDRVTGLRDLIAEVGLRAAPAFGVLLGNAVGRPTAGRYALLRDALARARPAYPIRAVPGDLDRRDPRRGDLFVRFLGPRSWWLLRERTLVVGVDDAEGPLSVESVGTLARSASDADRVVVVAHRPFHVVGETGAEAALRRRRFTDLRRALGGRHVDAVVAGHERLWQDALDEDGTRHVTNGHVPGEDGVHEVPTAALVRVGPGGIEVERVQVRRRLDVGDSLRRVAVAGLGDRFARIAGRLGRPRRVAAR